MFLIDLEGSKKQLLDEDAALKVIDNNFESIKQITTLQESKMRYRVKLQDSRTYLVESSKMESFIDAYFPLMESMSIEEAVDWEKIGFYPMVFDSKTNKMLWYGDIVFDKEAAINSSVRASKKVAEKNGVECYPRVIDSDNAVAFTERPGESVNKKYAEQPETETPAEEITTANSSTDDEGNKLAALSPEEAKIFKLDSSMSTDEMPELRSRAEDIIHCFRTAKHEFLDAKEAGAAITQQWKDGKFMPSQSASIQYTIEGHRKRQYNAKREMMNCLTDFQQLQRDAQELSAKRTRHHDELKQRFNMNWKKEDRFANRDQDATKPAAPASSLRDLLAKSLASRNNENNNSK